MSTSANGLKPFAVRALVVGGLIVLGLFLWRIHDVVLLAFAAVLVAVVLDGLADPLAERWPWGRDKAVLAVGVLLLAALVGLAFLFGRQLVTQGQDLLASLPEAVAGLDQRFPELQMRAMLEKGLAQVGGSGVLSQATGLVTSTFGAVLDLVIVICGGAFMAVAPDMYRQGLVKLVPGSEARREVDKSLSETGEALRLWLIAKLTSMTITGVLVGAGFWLIGLPSPVVLGLFYGLTAFIPFFGPIIGSIPALILASTLGVNTVLWTVALCLAVEQVESNLIFPLLQQKAVSLPPALTIFGVIAFGLVLGTLGVILAAPLTVAAFVMTKRFWVRDALDRETDVPGEEEARQREREQPVHRAEGKVGG